jgi:16S rRNA (guanine966-N2)-methyltransferase
MRGRLIDYHGEIFTRPMKDNIRENLFNILGQSVRGSICLDLFAGTGALSFESLSRGARSAVMIEQNRHAAACITKTAETLGVSARMKVLIGDAFRLSDRLLTCPEDDTPWIVFLCPPYALWDEALDGLCAMIARTLEHGPLGSVLAAEMPKTFDTDRLPRGNWDFRTYGGTRLGLIEVEAKCGLSL